MIRHPFTLDRNAGLIVDRYSLIKSGVMDRQLKAAESLYKQQMEREMNEREEYAKAALIGLLHPGHTYMPRHILAKEAFQIADAMMTEAAKVKPSGSLLHAEGRERVQAS